MFLNLGTPFEYFSCRNAFDDRCYSARTIRKDRLYEEMNMIRVSTYFQKFHLVSFLNLYTHFFHYFFHVLIKDSTSVLRRKNELVYEYCNIMASMYVFAHINILHRKRWGIQPEVIQKRSYQFIISNLFVAFPT